MSKFNLVTGLEHIIAQVEALPKGTDFRMDLYHTCVIGTTVGWARDSWGDTSESATLRKYFGIRKNGNEYFWKLFSNSSESQYTKRTWKVIRLFTDVVGDIITREKWLLLAKETLSEVKNEKQTKSNC